MKNDAPQGAVSLEDLIYVIQTVKEIHELSARHVEGS